MIDKLNFILVLIFITICSNVFGQNKDQTLEGKVTFITSKSVYVQFDDTQNIQIGDTLQISSSKTPCLIVTNKSSSSCVCSKINSCEVKKDDVILYNYIPKNIEPIKNEIVEVPIVASTIDTSKTKKSLYTQNIRGRITLANYSNFSEIRGDRNRLVTQLSITANHINDSKISVESYLNYSKNSIPEESAYSQKTDFLRVYNLALKYDVSPTFNLTVGRKINQKMSSVGAIDGLQVEKKFNNIYIGAIGGFRPDIIDQNFNSNLFQYGGYIGTTTDNKNFYSQTTLGVIEQRNNSETDRRYTYFQHSSTIFKKLNIFSSVELDLYDKINNDIKLTNLYLSARYKFSRALNVMLSYDSRKRIIYYETFKTQIERLLEDDIARRGLRARINIRPIKNVITGFSYSKRFQSNNQNKSDNFYVYGTLSKIPAIGGRLSINYNVNKSNYLESNIISFRHSRNFTKKFSADFYYRLADYEYINSTTSYKQNYYGTNLSYYINRKLLLSVSGELSTFDKENNYRVYAKIIKRFYSKRK